MGHGRSTRWIRAHDRESHACSALPSQPVVRKTHAPCGVTTTPQSAQLRELWSTVRDASWERGRVCGHANTCASAGCLPYRRAFPRWGAPLVSAVHRQVLLSLFHDVD